MEKTYETWMDAFHFTDDLKTLEQIYQQQHQETLQQQLQPESVATSTQTSSSGEDEAFLQQLSKALAQQLRPMLMEMDFSAQVEKIQQLQADNHLMACQIEQLLNQLAEKELESKALQSTQTPFYRLFGKFYVKLS
jgi:hypothetical protein